MKSILFGNSAVSFGDAIYITVVSMSIVFFILLLISFVLSFFKYFSNKENQNVVNEKINDTNTLKNLESENLNTNEKFSIEKIKDETMLVALLTALVDASENNKDCEIKVKNIKEIK